MYKPLSAESVTGDIRIAAVCDLALLRTRYFNPTIGRFTSFDDFEADAEEVQHQHKYNYAGADPVNNVDPGGEDFFTVIGQSVRAGVEAIGRSISLVGGILVRRAAFALVRAQVVVYQAGLRLGIAVASGAGATLRIGQSVATRLSNPGSLGAWANQLTPNMLRQLAANPAAQRFVDVANKGNVQVLQRLPGLSQNVYFRVTLAYNELDKIISIGQIRIADVAKYVQNGRYLPLQ